MKLLLLTLSISLVLSGAFAKPASPGGSDDDVELIEGSKLNRSETEIELDGVDVDGDDDSYFPYFFNFGSIWDSFEDILRGFRTNLHDIFSGTDENGNTTSTVKVIDNHKVIINETTYQKETPYGTQFVKVHRVSVHPLDGDADVGANNDTVPAITGESPESLDAEELDDSNQIPRDDDKVKPIQSEKLRA